MIHHPNADGPADWITAAFVMNNTIATKIATMSNVVSTLGRMPPATRSEISEPDPVSVVMAAPPQLSSIALIVALPGGVGSPLRFTHLGHLWHPWARCPGGET